MTYVRRLPSDDQVEAFYQSYDTFKGYAAASGEHLPLSWTQRVFQCSQSLHIEALEQTGGIRGMKVLDFGCSTGRFLELVRFKGGFPQGVEIDGHAREKAAAVGIPVQPALPTEGSYDIICAFQVLEHLESPLDLVQRFAKLLKPEGRLIVAVPNATEMRDFGRNWLGFRVDLEHFNYFTVATMGELMRRAGLWPEHSWQHLQAALVRTDLPLQTLEPGLRAKATRMTEMLFRTLFAPPARFLEGSFNLSVLARKA